MKPWITVWSICWGDKYSDYYVQRLQREVRKHLSYPHRFACITDRHIEGVWTIPFEEDFPGWWSKVALFKPGVAARCNLWLDLDVVITGSLDDLIDTYGQSTLAAPTNWAQSGHGGVQSSVMVWADNAMARKIYDLYDPADPRLGTWPPDNTPPKLWGDQEWITELRSRKEIKVEPINPAWVRSYKYHCRDGLPADTRVVVFHGDPKPNAVREPWLEW